MGFCLIERELNRGGAAVQPGRSWRPIRGKQVARGQQRQPHRPAATPAEAPRPVAHMLPVQSVKRHDAETVSRVARSKATKDTRHQEP